MTARPGRRVLALALDAASAPLLEAWSADGTLPHLAELRRRGASGPTHGIDGFFVGATWPSFCTGLSPARHGIYNLVRMRPGRYDLAAATPADLLRCPPLWDQLCAQGRRAVVLDVPLCPPSAALAGVQVVEWGCHDALCGFSTSPPSLADEIVRHHGAHPVGANCDASRRTPDDWRRFAGELRRGIEVKTAITLELMAREDWDFFIQVFSESHCAGHQAWHLHDPRHPAFAAARASGDLIRDTYVALDRALGAIVARAGDDTTLLVLALHGMSHWHGAQILLHDMLVRLGATAPPRVPFAERAKAHMRALLALGWGCLPAALKRSLAPLSARTQAALRSDAPALGLRGDPRSSRCFAVHNGFAAGGIRLNLRGREPSGVLEPGAEADRFCETLFAELRQVIDPDSGRPLVRDVWRTATRFAGERLDELPDIVVEWADDEPLGGAAVGQGEGATVRAWSSRIGHLEGANRYCRSGEHRPGGLFIACGPGLAAQRLAHSVSILDFAPTIAAWLDCRLERADGQPIPELLTRC